MGTGEFLRLIWPETGWYCLAFPRGEGFKHAWFETIDEVVAVALQEDARGITVYHACASFKEPSSRRQTNAARVRSLWLDLDVGSTSNKFGSQADALRSFKGFLETTLLPAPLLVSSGGGFHAYWCFTESIDVDTAKPIAEKLKALCIHHGFKADPARTADMASILRPVGTHNTKYKNIPTVAAINSSQPISFESFSQSINNAASTLPSPHPSKKKQAPTANDDLLIPHHYEKSIPIRCVDSCQQLRRFVEKAITLDEPSWYAGIQCLHFCEGGDAKIHEWSSPHPGYSSQQTEAKIAQIAGLGPTTCATFELRNPTGCDGCPHKGKITSPIVLGISYPELRTPPAIDDGDIVVRGNDEAIGFIPPPKPYKRTAGGVYVTIDGVDKKIHEYDLVLVNLAWDEQLGYEVAAIKHYTPQDGWLRFRFRSSLIANPIEFEKVFRDNHVKPYNANLLRFYIKDYMDVMQRACKLARLYSSMGWKDGTNEFVLGKKLYRSDGSIETVAMADNKSLSGFGSKGDLEPWIEATTLFDTLGLEAHAFTASVWTGAPLMKFAGLPAALFSIVGQTNSGKSSMADFFLSAYGEYRKLSMREDDTGTVKDTRMGGFGSLPVYIDETTNKDPKTLSDFVYQITQGRSKARGRIDGSERPTMEWNTIVVSSANSSLTARLGIAKANPNAERVRLFEYHVEPHPSFSRSTSQRLHDDVLNHHYGRAGEEYIKYVVTHQDEVRNGLTKVIKTLDQLSGAPDEERYISTSVGCVLYGSMLAKKIGLLRFDVMRLWPWAVNAIRGGRTNRAAEQSDEIELLGQYLNEHAQTRMLVDESRSGQRSEIQVLQYPKTELHQRYEINSGVMWIDRRHFRNWLVKTQENYEIVKKTLLDKGVLLCLQKKVLAAGSGLGGVAVDCLKVDMNKPVLGNVLMELVPVIEDLQTKARQA